MILELENAVVETLRNAGIKVYPWSGQIDELFSRPRETPTLRIVIEKMEFEQISLAYKVVGQISVLLFFRNLRDESQGAYPLIAKVINALSNKIANGFLIKPISVSLLYHEAGEFAYQLNFKAEGRWVVPEEDEAVVKIISFEEVA